MNTPKKLISVILCLITIFSLSVTSFAADAEKADDTVKVGETVSLWGTEDYIYSGEADEKGITVESGFIDADDYFNEETGVYESETIDGKHCCRVSADKAGYYALLWKSENEVIFTAWVYKGEGDTEEGTFKNSVYVYDESCHLCGVIFKMSEGEKEYAFLDECDSGKYTIHSEYLGTPVSAVSASELIRNYGADAYYDEEYSAVVLYPYLNVTFSEGQTEKIQIHALSDDSINSENVNIDAEILGAAFPVTVKLIDGESLVKSLSFPEDFTPSCIEHYDGTISDTVNPDYMIITLTDGTELKTGNMENVVLPNGRSYTASWEYDVGNENGEIRREIKFTGDLLGNKEVTITFVPEPAPIKNTLSDVFEIYGNYSIFGWKLILNMREPTEAYEDWTRAEGFSFVASIFSLLINSCRYYRIMGTHFIPFVLITGLIFAMPLIIIAAVVLIIIAAIKHKKKKKS